MATALAVAEDTKTLVLRKLEELQRDPLEYVIFRLMRERSWAREHAEAVREEFFRFMALLSVTGEILSPSRVVDDFWHEFILFTRDYTRYCQQHFGKYIHHQPKERGPHEVVFTDETKCRTAELLATYYPNHNPDLWCMKGEGADCDGGSCCGMCSA